jgi:hypothetical protein
VSPEVRKEIDRLLTEKLLHQSLNFLVDVCKDECLTILFLNIRSLYAHFQDIENDPNFTKVDINIYSETKLSGKHDSKDFTLLGYDMHRHDCLLQTIATTAYGMAVYSKVQHKDQVIHTHREILPAVGVIEFVTINLPSWDLCVIEVYASPKESQHIPHGEDGELQRASGYRSRRV